MMPQLYVYAELLLHIRQLTLYASLSENKDKGTQVLLSSDKKVITAVYGDETASIYLPTQIKGTANVTFPLKKRTEFSTKLQIDDQNDLQQAIDASAGIQVPWTSTSLTSRAEFKCKSCSTSIVEPGCISDWKDLPSENWAELMDLWFCHKPHGHNHNDMEAAESKGFSATSKLVNKSGTGLVDTMSFVLHAEDSKAVQAQDQNRFHSLECPQCHAFVGTLNTAEGSHRLWKSRLALQQSGQDLQTYEASVFIGAQMLQLIETTISRRIIVHSGGESGLLCWVFNPDIYYSSSKRGATVHRAMKIFYKEVEQPQKLLDEHNTTLEELALPESELEALREALISVQAILPVSARTFQEWQVGLLDRYEEKPSGLGAMDQNALNHKADNIELFKLPPGWDALYE